MIKRTFWIRSSDQPWLALQLRAVMPEERSPRAVLLLHGTTLCGYIFDLRVAGPSLQERLAVRGWASYALDARGFGGSVWPTPGDPGFDEERPFARAADVIADVTDTVHFLREERGHPHLALVGFSWGANLAGLFAAADTGTIDRLGLYAPIYATPNPAWIRRLCDPRNPAAFNPAFGAYRSTSEDELRARWDSDIPVPDKERWRAEESFQAVIRGALENDPLSFSQTPPAFRTPNGPFADLFSAFTGQAAFEAAAIRVPALIVRGDADTTSTDADARRLLHDLGSSDKRYQTIASSSHFLPFERSAPSLNAAFEEFLET
ncbi:MAG TPA: alpha/beta fold hydrolase [Blastocatellia bacterium]|nr:alpha/beta fold hydrolase [Blastocatellia bacterium]